MPHLSTFRITLLCALLLGVGVLLFAVYGTDDGEHATAERIARLEKNAEARRDAFHGLSPCRIEQTEWAHAARRALDRAGEPSHHALVVVAPSFSDVHLLGIGPFAFARYRIEGVTGFLPEFINDTTLVPQKLEALTLDQSVHQRLLSAIQRNARYAFSDMQFGADGTLYIFANGVDHCAVVWSPNSGLAFELVAAVEALLSPEQSAADIRAALERLERIESSSPD